MIIEIKVPTPGESITEVEIASWLVEDGSIVAKDQEIAEIESDKATLMLSAEEGGQIAIKAPEGEPIKVGSVACTIDTDKAGEASEAKTQDKNSSDDKPGEPAQKESTSEPETKKTSEKKEEKQPERPKSDATEKVRTTPIAEKMMDANHVSVDEIMQGLRRLDKNAVTKGMEGLTAAPDYERASERKKMSSLRRKVSERLVAVKNETAMLTTFNEVDMSAVMQMRKQYQKKFTEKHGIKLGFMSFFTKAAAIALKTFPEVNAMIDGEEIIYFNYADIGIAVQTPKGLMVPIIRDTSEKGVATLEEEINAIATKARNGKISIDDLKGGTFSITNGGVFGSMLSTPILNPPQAAILGMHNIQDRPVAIDGQVVIRPIMYLALSYDHRIIDGKSSVGFLKMIKELIEEPTRLLIPGDAPSKLLDL